jgi:hypothetical protein
MSNVFFQELLSEAPKFVSHFSRTESGIILIIEDFENIISMIFSMNCLVLSCS